MAKGDAKGWWRRVSDDSLRSRVERYMAEHNVLGLATAGPDGPWSSPVFYAHDPGLRLLFLTDPATRHGQNLGLSGRAAGSITEDYRDWPEIRGLQLEGLVERLTGPEREAALGTYLVKFPSAGPFLDPAHPLYARAGGKAQLYRLTPVRISMTDNTRGFGRREWLELGG